ncbi:MAG: Glycogen debranching enzyme (Alpha-1,6-glucosidase) [uncultured Friedmanniella sp.]|uniref:Glycogen debranching enzyme (Alpha-1,6-glucosidase) n=1 Tax=uncultured Friedmanniella sp. TaxID=335381 RepID=A0A6J4KTN9_9ACTN|nr:MAG: Glycogen debranching enzyme (Alpha-1,6-glucosidase) [uncultured Friedmanniella sp.]
MPQPLQPFLHDLVTVLAAPTQVLSARTGDVVADTERAGAQGVLHADVRVLSRVVVEVDGDPGEHIATEEAGRTARFTTLLRHVGAGLTAVPDPTLRLDRDREVEPGGMTERLRLSSVLADDVPVTVTASFAADLATVETIKTGRRGTPGPLDLRDGRPRWGDDDIAATLTAAGATWSAGPGGSGTVASWSVVVPAHGSVEVGWRLDVSDRGGVVVAAADGWAPEELPPVADSRLAPWLRRSLEDLDGLRMARPQAPGDVFFAAGAPWYLTLFGRDSLWAARLVLPVSLEPARGTLRALAALQGTTTDVERAEQPGKIMHELRRGAFGLGTMSLPPLYYGTIDATPLWVCLLHDAWRAGLPEAEVRELLPALEAALGWLLTDFDADGDGFGEYLDESGHGLANQGWKDSADSVRFRDGRIAEGPVALCEVQGYAHEAAVSGAALLEAFDRPGAERLRTWAAGLADRFRDAFWVGEGEDRYPALALDGHGTRVDSLTSNIGHLLGTGLLDAEEERLVARHVAGPALDSGLGLRTMSTDDAGFSPLSYHCGSVWPHDTAVVVAGLARAGLAEHASGLVEGLLRASVAFEQRLPELWSGEGRPVPYPASCRPQAWSAAAAVVVASVLGLGSR